MKIRDIIMIPSSRLWQVTRHNTVVIIMRLEIEFYLTHSRLRARCTIVVEAIGCKPECRGFETRWSKWIISIYLTLPAALGPGFYSASNINEYYKQKYMFLGSLMQPVRKADNHKVICQQII
jgi:hypothetical protein